ncbi:restriction endonuclease subunit S [Vibrio aestuarianus]|uniref:restriction endonuclease subunit S n=1 Tax=Vibrio aestuarianus TaxID=28171 RepID=UPI00237C533B|nr:restriction endonuclease subunit S [Vibrio aestuarianus]MDE1253573.1 restriction endonuclease subunit S [Vibrio aestuarianus]
MSLVMRQLNDLLVKVDNWNPVKQGGDKLIKYIDLSSVDKDAKQIISSEVQEIVSKKAPSRARQLVAENDILVATVRPNLNGVARVPSEFAGATASTGYCVLRVNSGLLDPNYLFYWVQTDLFIKDMMSKATGANYPAVSDRVIKGSKIPLPPLDEQKRIAAILDKADAIRQKRKQAIDLADEFLRSVFLDMFGDPVTNPKVWEVSTLNNFGSFKNGMNFSKGEIGNQVYCIGVGDFKSFDRIFGTSRLSTINLNEMPDNGYLLQDNDLLFVRSNGNKALVGRCVSVHPGSEEVTFSGFCIRYRIELVERLDADFVNYCLRIPSMKHAMLKGGQGANIQNINQQILSNLQIPVPPIELQKKYATLVASFRDLQEKLTSNQLVSLEAFNSLSQKAFSGQL